MEKTMRATVAAILSDENEWRAAARREVRRLLRQAARSALGPKDVPWFDAIHAAREASKSAAEAYKAADQAQKKELRANVVDTRVAQWTLETAMAKWAIDHMKHEIAALEAKIKNWEERLEKNG